ncbi:MAG: OmpH family outer membrane protein [Dysgonomonas sp.]
MMKKIFFLTVIISLSSLFANRITAQEIGNVAYINSKEILDSIPEKIKASKAISELNKKYKDELLVMQADYNKKYSDYMTYESSMTESIKLRRIQELHTLEENISQFMQVAQEDVNTQEQLQIEPLREKVKEAINAVGLENDFVCIYDLANPAIVFVTPKAIDATPLVKEKLGIKKHISYHK